MIPTSGMASCYFWCTHNGDLPQVVGDGSKDYTELLEELAPKQHEIKLRPSFLVTQGKGLAKSLSLAILRLLYS